LDAERAFSHVRALVDFGPRPVGSEGHAKAEQYIQSVLKELPLEVEVHSFDVITPRGTLKMRNLIARQKGGDNLPVIILASHYDTMLSEYFPFVGANDGGSSTGLLLELARAVAARQSPFQYWFVVFDGEEALRQWSDMDSLYGSRQFVGEMKARGWLSRVKTLVLLDMVGDKGLSIKRDTSSTGWLVDLFWDMAAKGKYSGFQPGTMAIMDDHTPFVQEGVPALDVIDFDYGPGNSYWHSAEDTLDKVSAESLQQVGDVVLRTLPALERALADRDGRQ
jgi:Zn-dependent M28 family amino/carboxypeptidase